jgi:hypothetical protein
MIFKFFGVDRYYKMSDHKLELEANKYNLGEYVHAGGGLSRQLIINQLIQKDEANLSTVSILLSVVSLVVSVTSLFIVTR